MNEIIWEGSEDDLTAKVEEYVLHVWGLDGIWRWIFYKGSYFYTGNDVSKSVAQSACIEAYLKHKNNG